jgi:D-glycero-D-manno-heptose 1,7-bisphosphate phosphatase
VAPSSRSFRNPIGAVFNLLRFVFSNDKKGNYGPAIFIDRDGVINSRRPGDYVLDWSQFAFVPGIRSALKQLSRLGFPLIIISNQAAVGKGLLNPSVLQEITTRLYQCLLADGTSLSAAYYCPHRPSDNCVCRKPKPKLLYKAADDFNVDLSRSIFIGDSDTDVQAAQAADCKPVLFGSGLRASSAGSGWEMSPPTALAAKELFDVAVRCLQEKGRRIRQTRRRSACT